MEALKQARNLYVKMHSCGSSLSDEDRSRLKRDIQRFIIITVREIALKDIFVNPCMFKVLNVALNNRASHNSTDLVPVVKAFEYLERYMLLLLEQPWKDEFKKLKMYGGFYRTRIKSALQVPEDIFHTAGYHATKDDTLIHTGSIDKNSLLLLAFDCKIASVQSRTVADTYCKEKNIGKSLSSVISDRMGSTVALEQDITLPNDVHRTSHQLADKREASKIQIPPALPRRDPIVPQSQHRQKMDYESALAAGIESGPHVFGVHSKANGVESRFAPPQTFVSSSLGPRSPLLSSNAIRSNFSYVDVEKIPELPQGTIDDHMRESVKFLSQERPASSVSYNSQQRPKSNDWDSLRSSQIGGSRTVPLASAPHPVTQLSASHRLSVNTYPPGSVRYNGGRPTYPFSNDVSISSDEGIGSSSRFMQNSLYSQVTSPSHEFSPGQVPVMNHSIKQRVHPPLQNSYSAPIYTPPSIDESDGVVPCMMSQQSRAPPPPIPSRALKPVLPDKPINSNDIKGIIYSTPSGIQTIVEHHKPSLNPSVNVQPTGQVDIRTTILPQSSQTEPILRRDRYRVGGKSSSLKYGDERSAAINEMANRPLTRSMDLTLTQWQCRACSSLNMASDSVCPVCAHSRQGPDTSHVARGSRKKKACPRCTLENEVDLTHCSCCGSKLDDCFTYT